MSHFLRQQAFTLGLFAAIALAFLSPDTGASGGLLRSDLTARCGIVAIFLMQGLTLRTRSLLQAATRIRLNLTCQATIFLLSPLLVLPVALLTGRSLPPALISGLWFLSILPTTISSAIVFTDNADGNTGVAIFNTTFSNLLGVLATPLLCMALVSSAEQAFPPIGGLVVKIALLVAAPIAVGQILRPFMRDRVASAKPTFKLVSNGLIIYIVYAAFCNSVASGIHREIQLTALVVILFATAAHLGGLSALSWHLGRLVTTTRSERVAFFFCASQKTLAAGAPMAALLFASSHPSEIGLILLPLLIYHPLQLLLAGILAPRMRLRDPSIRSS